MPSKIRASIFFVSITFLMMGCASREELAKRVAGRWGPDPVINADDTNSVTGRQRRVLEYIVHNSGIVPDPSVTLNPISDPRWYDVAEWGFNVGREDCSSYLDNLFRINREKQRNHDLINALQVATIGIVTAASPHNATALSVLGQAFGLATAVNDNVLQSYLFTEAPGLISIKIKQLQDDYQKSLAKNSITSAPQAYSALQNYYNICLPQSIEGVILQKVATSDASSGDKPAAISPTAKAAKIAPPKTPAGSSKVIQKTPELK